MFRKKKKLQFRSLIGEGTEVKGGIYFTEGLRVDGSVTGDIHANSDQDSLLLISQSARIVGKVNADKVIVNGLVQGPIYASELLEIQPNARIEGDVHYKALEMHQGATITGQLRPMDAVNTQIDPPPQDD